MSRLLGGPARLVDYVEGRLEEQLEAMRGTEKGAAMLAVYDALEQAADRSEQFRRLPWPSE